MGVLDRILIQQPPISYFGTHFCLHCASPERRGNKLSTTRLQEGCMSERSTPMNQLQSRRLVGLTEMMMGNGAKFVTDIHLIVGVVPQLSFSLRTRSLGQIRISIFN